MLIIGSDFGLNETGNLGLLKSFYAMFRADKPPAADAVVDFVTEPKNLRKFREALAVRGGIESDISRDKSTFETFTGEPMPYLPTEILPVEQRLPYLAPEIYEVLDEAEIKTAFIELRRHAKLASRKGAGRIIERFASGLAKLSKRLPGFRPIIAALCKSFTLFSKIGSHSLTQFGTFSLMRDLHTPEKFLEFLLKTGILEIVRADARDGWEINFDRLLTAGEVVSEAEFRALSITLNRRYDGITVADIYREIDRLGILPPVGSREYEKMWKEWFQNEARISAHAPRDRERVRSPVSVIEDNMNGLDHDMLLLIREVDPNLYTEFRDRYMTTAERFDRGDDWTNLIYQFIVEHREQIIEFAKQKH